MGRLLVEVDAELWKAAQDALAKALETDCAGDPDASLTDLEAQDAAASALGAAAAALLADAHEAPLQTAAGGRGKTLLAGVMMAGVLKGVGDFRNDPENPPPPWPKCAALIDDVVIPATVEQCRALAPHFDKRVGLLIEIHAQGSPAIRSAGTVDVDAAIHPGDLIAMAFDEARELVAEGGAVHLAREIAAAEAQPFGPCLLEFATQVELCAGPTRGAERWHRALAAGAAARLAFHRQALSRHDEAHRG
jgi:hypothetical protein